MKNPPSRIVFSSRIMSDPGSRKANVVMWMNQPSRHQEDLAAEMRRLGMIVTVIYASSLRKERQQIGWEVDADTSETRFLSNRLAFMEAVELFRRHRHSVHIVNGIWAESAFFLVLGCCFVLHVPCCIYSESPNSMVKSSWSGHVKRPIQRFVVRLLARRMWLLAISWIAEQSFSRLGFPAIRIYRFGYFENPPQISTEAESSSQDILYVGRLVKGKGLELLIEAAKALLQEHSSLRLRIVGGGVIEPKLRNLAQATGVERQILFSGVIPSRSLPASLKGAAMLVLPSEEDGWGMVINQALQAGTPVVVSDSCGASELVMNRVNGYIFRTGDVNHLSRCMRAVLDRSGSQQMRVAAMKSGEAVSAKAAAPYLRDCLEHMLGARSSKPVPNWIQNPEPRPADF